MFKRKAGMAILEAVTTILILSLVIGTVIQAIGSTLRASQKLRQSFEASLLLDSVLFDVKSDEKGERYARTSAGHMKPLFTKNAYWYRIDSRLLDQAKEAWGELKKYQDFEVRLSWKKGQEYLIGQTVLRVRQSNVS